MSADLHTPDAHEAQWLREARTRLDNSSLHLRSSTHWKTGGRLVSVYGRGASGAPYLLQAFMDSWGNPRRPNERDIVALQKRARGFVIGKKVIPTNGRKGAALEAQMEIEDQNRAIVEKRQAALKAEAREKAADHLNHAVRASVAPGGIR